MKNRVFPIALFCVLVAIVSFPLWFPMPEGVNVSDSPQGKTDSPLVPEDPSDASSPTTDGASEAPTENIDAPDLFSSGVSFAEAQKRYPDAHPAVAAFKSLFTEEEYQAYISTPRRKRFMEIMESDEYAAFITTNPTTREFDEFWTKHGFGRDPDRYQKAFREEFPTGEPEDFELEMRQALAELFRDADPDNMMQEIITRGPKFFENPRQWAWMKGYFDRDDGFGAWAQDVVENLSANLVELPPGGESDLQEVIGVDASVERSPVDNAEEVGAPLSEGGHSGPAVETVLGEAETLPNVANSAPEFVDIDALLTEGRFESVFTDEGLETLLSPSGDSEAVSPERVASALDILNRYGPSEGLRRLRDSDPEVAKQIEGVIRKRSVSEKAQ